MNQQVCLIVASLISVLGGSAGYSIIESFHEIPDLDADVVSFDTEGMQITHLFFKGRFVSLNRKVSFYE